MKKELFEILITVKNGNEKQTRKSLGHFTAAAAHKDQLAALIAAKTPRFVDVDYETKREETYRWQRTTYMVSETKYTGKVPAWATAKKQTQED